MDKEYILMCIEATEIQELWKPKEFDLYLFEDKDTREGFIDCCPAYLGRKWDGDIEEGCKLREQDIEVYKDLCVWLPRQEDLQQIFKEEKQVSEDITLLLFKRYIADLGSVCTQCEGMSITKAWLCCIMEKLYAKDWDSESKTWVSL